MVSQATVRAPATESPPPTKYYFAYGSNLHLRQMKRRCPDSKFIGWARLPNYRWHINERGYANVVEAEGHWVDGLVYEIGEKDEARLDINEGVSKNAYAKQYMRVILHRAQSPLYRRPTAWIVDQGGPAKILQLANANHDQDQMDQQYKNNVLVYISLNYITDSEPKKEYINRINLGVTDARALGVGNDYIINCIRPFVPPNPKKTATKAKTSTTKAGTKAGAGGGGGGGGAGGSGAGGGTGRGRTSGNSATTSASAKRDASPVPAKKKQPAAHGSKRTAAQRSATSSPARKAPAASRQVDPSPQRSSSGHAQRHSTSSLPRPSAAGSLQHPAAGNPQRSPAGNVQRPTASNLQRLSNLLAVPSSDRRRAASDVGPTPPPLPPRPPRRMQSIPVIIDDRHINITLLR